MEPPSPLLQDLMDPSSTIPCSSSDKSTRDERKRTKGSGVHTLPSKSTTMTPSTSSVAPSTAIPKSEIYVSLLSTSRMAPPAPKGSAPTSNKLQLSVSRKRSTPIPKKFERIYDASTPDERRDFLNWVRFTELGKLRAIKTKNSGEFGKMMRWAYYTAESAAYAPEERKAYLNWAHATSSLEAPVEHNWRFLKWAHSTSTIQRKSWSLLEEISKPFETALNLFQEELNLDGKALKYGCSNLKQEHMIYACDKEEHGVYQCQNALWIWPKLRYRLAIYDYQKDGGLKRVGKKIREKFPESVLIKGTPDVNRLGFVTMELSGEWMAKSIHKMLKDGIDTWAPKLPVERVIVEFPSVREESVVDSIQQRAIGYTLMRIIEYCKVDVIFGHPLAINIYEDLKDGRELTEDLLDLWFGFCQHRAVWILYVTPIRQLEYIKTCFTAAKLKWIPSDTHKPPRTSYAGYRSCTNELEDNFIKKAKACWVAVEQGALGESAKLLGYTDEAVVDCVFTFTILKNHRLAFWEFEIDEMFNKEGNSFLYLLNTWASIRKITVEFREDINNLKMASEFRLEELILEKGEGWEKGEERILGFHLLKFTEALEESCLCVLPHIVCEYLYDLSQKFNSYYLSVCKVGSVRDTSTLLLCEATAAVTEKCFHLLGIDPSSLREVSVSSSVFGLKRDSFENENDLNDLRRYPPKNSRLEVFSFHTAARKQINRVLRGGVFGLISVSDKYGLSDRGSHFYDPDFAHVSLFNQAWHNPVKTTDWGLVYLGNPSSSHSVQLNSSIEFRMELYVTKKKNACYQLCNHKVELDLSNFWAKKSDNACGVLTVEGEDGPTSMYYVLLKEAVDARIKVSFETTHARKVRGYVVAYYGDDFFYECDCPHTTKDSYSALLFLLNTRSVLKNCDDIPLIRSKLAVPAKKSLIIKAYLEDKDRKVIMKNICKFKSVLEAGCTSEETIDGTDCFFTVTVDWNMPT